MTFLFTNSEWLFVEKVNNVFARCFQDNYDNESRKRTNEKFLKKRRLNALAFFWKRNNCNVQIYAHTKN